MPGFLASGGKEFKPGPVTRLDGSELLYFNEVLLKYKRERKLLTYTSEAGRKSAPLLVFIQMLYSY